VLLISPAFLPDPLTMVQSKFHLTLSLTYFAYISLYSYLSFLTDLRAALPDSVTISITAPASYWYLQNFPIANISKVVDYIVYMTYDLHGQWDYGNDYSDSGCPDGNCLRSHVNMTETLWALAMITKAGVPSNKVVVGVASYGRSFGMTDPDYTGHACTYEGPNSTATPGMCTDTAGYLANAEIYDLLNNNNDTTSSSTRTRSLTSWSMVTNG
jgi:chitinase